MKLFSVLAVALLALNVGCEKMKDSHTTTSADPLNTQTPAVASLNVGNVLVSPAASAPVLFAVEVASTKEQKSQGLMGRESLSDKQGMWFVFEQDSQDPFWMKDTPLALDMIFVDSNNKIVDIIANTTPNSSELLGPCVSNNSLNKKNDVCAYRFVLEVKAGTAAANRMAVGDKAEFRLGPP